MNQSTKLVMIGAILSVVAIALTLASTKSISSMFLFLFSCLSLALCYCFRECRWASIFALLNLILAINSFDLVGLILIGSTVLSNNRKILGRIVHNCKYLWNTPVHSICDLELYWLATIPRIV